jgi:hypothetical protein
MNEPSTMSEYLVVKISRAENAVEVRKMLLSYYVDGDTTGMKLRRVKEVLEEYVKVSREDVEEIDDSSVEVVAKEEQLKSEEDGSYEGKKEEDDDDD